MECGKGVVVFRQHNGEFHLGKCEVPGEVGDRYQAFGPARARIVFHDREQAGAIYDVAIVAHSIGVERGGRRDVTAADGIIVAPDDTSLRASSGRRRTLSS